MSMPFIKSITRIGTRDLINEEFGEQDNHIHNQREFIQHYEKLLSNPKQTYKEKREFIESLPKKEMLFLIQHYGLNHQ
jgi:hypothetical protein